MRLSKREINMIGKYFPNNHGISTLDERIKDYGSYFFHPSKIIDLFKRWKKENNIKKIDSRKIRKKLIDKRIWNRIQMEKEILRYELNGKDEWKERIIEDNFYYHIRIISDNEKILYIYFNHSILYEFIFKEKRGIRKEKKKSRENLPHRDIMELSRNKYNR